MQHPKIQRIKYPLNAATTHATASPSANLPLRERLQSRLPSSVKKAHGWHSTQTYRCWNVRFASELREPANAAREALAEKDARAIAHELC